MIMLTFFAFFGIFSSFSLLLAFSANRLLFLLYIRKKRMRKQNRTTSFVAERIGNVEQIHSLLYIDRGSMEDVEDGKLAVSEVQTLEESFLDLSRRDIEPNFKKNTAKAILQHEKDIKAMQKSKFAVLGLANLSRKQISQQAINTIESDILELQAIEKKTEDLVQREKEQRRQLKKLKKAYIQKVEELMKKQQDHKVEKQSLSSKIQTLSLTQDCLFKQKTDLQSKMKALEMEVEDTKRQLSVSEEEKLNLLRKIELLEINNDYQSGKDIALHAKPNDRIRQLIGYSELEAINSQVDTIDKLIEQASNQPDSHEGKYKKMARLLEMKNHYLEQREIVNLENQRTIYDKTVSRLNDIAFNRERLSVQARKMQRQASQRPSESKDNHRNSETFMKSEEGTKDSFFSRGSFTTNQNQALCESKLYFKDHDIVEETPQDDVEDMKERITKLVRSYKIIGHEQTYDVLQKLTTGIVQLYSSQECTEDDLINLIEDGLEKMNDGLVLKAKNTIDRIEKLMNFVRMSNDAKNMRQKENILKDKQPK